MPEQNRGIREGGCIPPFDDHPPFPVPVPPYPSPDKDPWLPKDEDTGEPTSLEEEFDWMTYRHAEMWDMVHTGMNLSAASDVAYGWEQLGAELDDISTQLSDVLGKSAGEWEGEAAETARLSMQKLVDWTRRTGEGATNVAACLALQVENADQARQQMPEPSADPGPPETNMPVQPAQGVAGAGTIPSGVSAFKAKDVASAPLLNTDHAGIVERDLGKRKQAAEVMQRFQQNSRQVYGKVPRFEDPANPVYSPYERREPDDKRKPPRDTGEPPGDTPGSTTSASSSTPATSPPPTGGGQPGHAATGTPLNGQPPGGTVGVGPNERGAPASGASGRFAIGGPAEPGAPAGGAPRAAGAGPGTGMGGAMVPPGAGAAGGAGDKERSRPSILEEDDDLFGLLPTAPSVIGEDQPDAR